mmetsp:Transcript_6603/g.17749  ORF Transcript_6603/g.17749 Transcript_6603/m.17749 type:complete len:441 (+) Transcript_6603:75-1397(+)|eukprot:CAMPEP_0185833596 /NCGR_PEP_ID=MMETSP1353-20130828/3170_1 /TAXON_ID=1077150 /ORGANISM="Erythrolobus australicus, Strain CCMP3124" /LENGTH=440 /DNA_ID=CAMNT_0028531907 /DNA_START=50 /DNA_END=1372 /DNA_ORIENTATION=+
MYNELFVLLLVVCVVARLAQWYVEGTQHQTVSGAQASEFRSFQYNYLAVYLLAVASDWLQGPYVYALYSEYGYDKTMIGILFIAGFGSSAIFGTFVASVADKYGRRANVMVFCVTYALSCMTKHSPNFWVLMAGRVLGGIATSILFSAFEAWLVYEHINRNYDAAWLSETFAKAQFGNGLVAIGSGQVAGVAAGLFGKVAPFDLSLIVLIVTGCIVGLTWTENYGDERASVGGGFAQAWANMMADKRILLIGAIQSAFEGAMYTFVFMWTPALQTISATEIPHGMIFSSFMVAIMIGSSLFTLLVTKFRIEAFLRAFFVFATAAFVFTIFSKSAMGIYCGFLAFEVICGVYFPAMGTLRSRYVPEETRSAIMNFFRLPLNVIVVAMLYRDMPTKTVFTVCAVLMFVAVVSIQVLMMYPARGSDKLPATGTKEAGDVHELT